MIMQTLAINDTKIQVFFIEICSNLIKLMKKYAQNQI